MSHNHTWQEAQEEELGFWLTPGAELGEQIKQITYAKYLGLNFEHDGNSPYVINKSGKDILDIGGGPVSLLLKASREGSDLRVVADPCEYPDYVDARYHLFGIDWWITPGERLYGDALEEQFDEIWMYNVLQHTEDPDQIFTNIYNALKPGGVLRFLDWIDTPTNTAHPISLTYNNVQALIARFQGELKQENINENGAIGKIAYGIFTK